MAAAEAIIVLSLLGCDDSGAQCDFVSVETERYETVEACRAASEPLLEATTEADYPTVVAVCSPESAMPTAGIAGSGEDVPLPLPPETPAEVDGGAVTVADNTDPDETGLQPAPFPPQPPNAGSEPPLAVAGGDVPLPDGTEPPAPAQDTLVQKEPGLLARVAGAITALVPERETLTKPIDVAADGATKVGGAVIVGVKRVAGAVNPF